MPDIITRTDLEVVTVYGDHRGFVQKGRLVQRQHLALAVRRLPGSAGPFDFRALNARPAPSCVCSQTLAAPPIR